MILNGIDAAWFAGLSPDAALKQRLGIPEKNRVVGIVANFRPMKHHETFIRAAAKVLQERDDVDFLLVGGTHSTLDRKEAMEALGGSLGIAAQLHFVGVQPDVRPYLSIMDIGVNCSEQEGLSNAVMEYMAASVPTVVSRSGGNPDLVTDEVTGLTFALNDPGALATHVLRLLGDAPARYRFASEARKRIVREMSNEAMLHSYSTLYAQAASPKRIAALDS